MPRNPEPGKRTEQQLPSYHLAARFREDSVSKNVYTQAQELIHVTDCDLSAYRFLGPSQVAKEQPWYVVVLGDPPAPTLHQQLETTLNTGERMSLPPEDLAPLYARRLQEIKKGSWVEAHRSVPLRRKQEKSKRNMQDKSRPRNREK